MGTSGLHYNASCFGVKRPSRVRLADWLECRGRVLVRIGGLAGRALGERNIFVRAEKLIVLAVFLIVVGAGFAFHLLSTTAESTSPSPLPSAGVSSTRAPGGSSKQIFGISLQLHNSDPGIPYEQYVSEIAATGADTISLVVAAYQENCASTSIFIDARKTPPDARVRALVKLARREGMRVVLMPIVLLENPRSGEWRGKISPTSWDEWWEDYGNYVLHYAHVAREAEVDLMMIGSELVSTEKQTDRWLGLIQRVRETYPGRLSYSANWDHYRPIEWWDKLDVIGMTTYYDLTGGKEPTLQQLLAGWRPIRKEILEWRAGIDRPILFTEVGWPNQETCAQYPWDYYRATDKPDPRAQANCFEAFFQTWVGEKGVEGFLVWEWRNYPSQNVDPQTDTSYIPCGKPAMDVIRRYFDEGARRAGRSAVGLGADL
jgi:Glycoside Hydrolase Family 113